MALKQLSAFVENKQGALVAITDILAKEGINLRALSIADTTNFGILRLIVDDIEKAQKILIDNGYIIKITPVIGAKMGDKPGELSVALGALDNAGINVEYLYAFMARIENGSYVVFRVADNDAAEDVLVKAGFEIINDENINSL